jgi:hypothetical protein
MDAGAGRKEKRFPQALVSSDNSLVSQQISH